MRLKSTKYPTVLIIKQNNQINAHTSEGKKYLKSNHFEKRYFNHHEGENLVKDYKNQIARTIPSILQL